MDKLKSLEKISVDNLLERYFKKMGNISIIIAKNRKMNKTIVNSILIEFVDLLRKENNMWIDGEWHYWDKRETCSTKNSIMLRMCFQIEKKPGMVLYIDLSNERKTK